MDAQTAAALAASRRVSFDAYHTEVLWAWGQDHEGWSISRDAIGDRERILTALSTAAGVIMPSSEDEMKKCWRRVMRAGTRTKFPLREHEQILGEDDELDEDDELEAVGGTVDPRDEELRRLRMALQKQHMSAPIGAGNAAAAAAAAPSPHVAASGARTHPATCGLCFTTQLVCDPSIFRCTTCGQLPHLGFAHEQNAYLRTLHTASAGQSNTAQTAAASSTPHLSKREKEFERLAAERPQLRRFASKVPLTVQEALLVSRQGYAAAEYDQTPASLLKLIQSGNLMKVGHALPRTLASANSRLDQADAVFLLQTDGKMTAADSLKAPPLTCLRDFTSALFCTILPALVTQPAATADWHALARTVHELDARWGWSAANAYLDMLLSDRVHRDASFAEYDRNMVDSARHLAPASGAAAGVHATQAAGSRGTHSSNPIATWAAGVCKDYNLAGCPRSDCKYRHECPWPECSGSDRRHMASDCTAKPASWRRGGDTRSVASARGGRGGAKSRGGRGGGGSSTVASTIA